VKPDVLQGGKKSGTPKARFFDSKTAKTTTATERAGINHHHRHHLPFGFINNRQTIENHKPP
jgi:hypothetical protein